MSIFKDSFPNFVREELGKRQKNIGSHSFPTVATLINRTSWVKLTSGVSIDGNSQITKDWVLFGGDSKIPGQVFKGYTSGNLMGIRPIPGITGINVDSISANGSLRQVTINFSCWDVSQLNILEKLYMRPGYTVCVEWGWSHNMGDNKPIINIPKFGDEFLKIGTNQQTTLNKLSLLDLYKEAYRYIQDNKGNYDVCIGKISNYNWSVREDGGYDCSTTIITYGEILESLKCNAVITAVNINTMGVGYVTPQNGKEFASNEEPRPHYERSFLEGYLFELKMWLESRNRNGVFNPDDTRILSKDNDDDFSIHCFITDAFQNANEFSNQSNKSGKKSYIQLQSFCDIINAYVIPKDNRGKIAIITTNPTKLSSNGVEEMSTKMNAHPIQLPMDVNVCVFYPKLWVEGIRVSQPDLPQDVISKPNTNYGTYKEIRELFKNGNVNNLAALTGYLFRTNKKKGDSPAFSSFTKIDGFALENSLNLIAKYVAEATTNIEAVIRKDDKLYNSNGQVVNVSSLSITNINEGYLLTLEDGTYVLIDQSKNLLSIGKSIDYNIDQYISLEEKAGITTRTHSYRVRRVVNVERLRTIMTSLNLGNQSKWFDYIFQKSQVKNIILNAQITSNITKEAFGPLGTSISPFFTDDTYSAAYIGNVYVNIDFILDEISRASSYDPNKKGEVSITTLFNNILNAIQNSIGSINDLRIHIDPLDNIARIIDMNYVDKNVDNLTEIILHKTNSIAKNYKLESMIFPEQSTIMAISAQTKSGRLGYSNQHLVAYNKGISDRIVPQMDVLVNNSNNDVPSQISSLLLSIASYYKTITSKPE
jgi:hypothetical protein